MADNFLEKRMEDYRSGRLGKRHGGMSRESGDVCLIFSNDLERVKALSTDLRKAGWRVAFCSLKSSDAVNIAQQQGCRYYPFNPDDESVRHRVREDVESRWGRIDREEVFPASK